MMKVALSLLCAGLPLAAGPGPAGAAAAKDAPAQALPRIRVAPDARSFVTEQGRPFVPFGVNYFRPGTGWAPQVWKSFDPEATRQDFARLKELGANCVRVFLTFGSFYKAPGVLDANGLARFDQFLSLAEGAGLYVHPTGPDHWEGLPAWAAGDRLADERVLTALEAFWRLFAARYRGRHVVFAYDLLNEPEVGWDTPAMHRQWNAWLAERYGSPEAVAKAWGRTNGMPALGEIPVPPAKEAPGSSELLDYQRFREYVADEWTRRQATAIRAADPEVMVTVGLIQWSVPVLLSGVQHYSGFRPERQARFLDFLDIHFYPLVNGFYEYSGRDDELANLAYLEAVVREVAQAGKPVVVAEFGWYGGGRPTLDQGRHAPATEAQQARWCRQVVEATQGLACGWLNWGLYDHPGAGDVTELIGLLAADGRTKAWGTEFHRLSADLTASGPAQVRALARPSLDWDRCLTDLRSAAEFRDQYLRAFKADRR